MILGTAGNDTIVGTPGPDCIFGLGGDDTIDGGNGDDLIVGGDGSDSLFGGNGNDQVFGDDGDDTIAGGNGADVIDGGPGNDVISGDNGPDDVVGGDGNDVILDSRGPTTISPGSGVDSCSGPGCELPAARRCRSTTDCASGEQCIGGACLICLADNACADGLFCDGQESCVPTLGCQPGTNPSFGTLVGTTCTSGAFGCSVTGHSVCDGIGAEFCDAVALVPTPDTNCDQSDNDCDGRSDEAFVGTPCSVGLFACARTGSTICDPINGEICAAVPASPRPDTNCDQIDDDCDGIADEGFVVSMTACARPGCFSTGHTMCTPTGVVNTCALPIAPEICDGADNDCDGIADNGLLDTDGDGTCDEIDRSPFHPDVRSQPGDIVTGRILCSGPTGDPNPIHFPLPLASFHVRTGVGPAVTDCDGVFTYVVPRDFPLLEQPDAEVVFSYETNVPGPAGVTSRHQVTDDFFNAWGTGTFHVGFSRRAPSTLTQDGTGRRTLTIAPIVLNTSECELFRVGVMVVDDYQRATGEATPRGNLTYMRRAGVFADIVPHVLYDFVDMTSDVLVQSTMNTHFGRERTLFHESAHVFRGIRDGDRMHWDFDSGAFRYARCHRGDEVTEAGYAFHEGWADYWRRARWSRVPGAIVNSPISIGSRATSEAGSLGAYCGGEVGYSPSSFAWTLASPNPYTDWVESLTADRLLALANSLCAGTTSDAADAAMMAVLASRPGAIHSIYEFETHLCEDVPACCAFTRASSPGPCPPGFHDDGLSCSGFGFTIRHP